MAYALRGGDPVARTESTSCRFDGLKEYDWHGRLMFGTDLPVCQSQEICGLAERCRQYVAAWKRLGIDGGKVFQMFVGVRNQGDEYSHYWARQRRACENSLAEECFCAAFGR